MTDKMTLMTVEDVAKLFQVEPSDIVALVESGDMGSYLIGGKYRFRDEQVREYLKASEMPSRHTPGSGNTTTSDDLLSSNMSSEINKQERKVTSISGESLSDFLNEQDIVEKMIGASEQDRPAAEAIVKELLNTFGQDIKQDRYKKMVGKYIKQVMEANGYSHDRTGVRCRPNEIFSVASTYRRAG